VELVACGEPLPLAIVERLADPAAIGAAEDSGLVVAEADGRRVQTWLAHPLYGDVLRARMRLARSRQLYGSLAAELLGTALNRRDDMLRAAVWQVDSGTITRPDVVREGARLAIGRASLDLAERLARAARAARPDPETDRLLAEILEYQGRSSEAAAILPVEPPADLVGRIKWAVTSSESSYWGDGDVVAAHAALDTVAGQPQVEASRSWILFFDGQCAQAVRTARTVLAGPDADPLAVVWASAAGIAAHGFLGDLDEARAMHRRAIPVARQHAADLPWAVFEIDVGACLAHLACGELRLAESIATAGYDTAVDANVPMMVAGWALYRGLVAVHRGHLADAEALLTEALAGFETSDTFRLSRCCLAALAWTCALRDDHAAARQWMARADRLTTGANRLFTPWLTLWRGWVARSAGAVGEATQLAAESADLARAGAMTTAEAVARYDQIRVGAPPGGWPLDRLATLPGAVPALLTTAARALAGHDDVALAGVADDLTAKGHDLLAAEVATIAARGLRKRGHDLAGVVAEKAAVLRGRCGDACTPLLTTPDLTTVLTPREREVLLMAAEHTSKQIAQRLGLAVPTVNNTLARAYTKLGIAGRAELRPLLRNARG
jgi:DNA-binding CsgD family transcriptional regulator